MAAVISTDADFREALGSILESEGTGVEIAVEITVPFPEIADPELQSLRRLEPGVLFLDLETDPHVGLKFAQFLMDEGLTGAIVGAGTDMSPDLLLSAMQAGVLEFLPKPVTPDSVVEAIDRLGRKTGKRRRQDQKKPGKLISFFSAKGGSGSTSLAANTAVEIQRLTRKRTLLVDLDLELGETALLLGMDPRFSIVDLVKNFHRVDAGLLASYIERHESGVELLSAPYEPADFEAVSGDRVGQILQFLKQRYDYVIVDTPKTFNPITLTSFENADQLLLVTTADLQSLRNLTRCLPLLRKVGRTRREDWLKLIVNRYDPRNVISLGEVRKTLGLDVFWKVRNDYQAVMESVNEGVPAVMREKTKYAEDVREMASRLTGVTVGEETSSGLLGRLKGLFGTDQKSDTNTASRVTTGE
jgi:pilus assembly protein CpaE